MIIGIVHVEGIAVHKQDLLNPLSPVELKYSLEVLLNLSDNLAALGKFCFSPNLPVRKRKEVKCACFAVLLQLLLPKPFWCSPGCAPWNVLPGQ